MEQLSPESLRNATECLDCGMMYVGMDCDNCNPVEENEPTKVINNPNGHYIEVQVTVRFCDYHGKAVAEKSGTVHGITAGAATENAGKVTERLVYETISSLS